MNMVRAGPLIGAALTLGRGHGRDPLVGVGVVGRVFHALALGAACWLRFVALERGAFC